MTHDFINYASLIDEAMHIIVKKSLEIAAKSYLPGDHHFFISFMTNYKGVELSPNIRKKYPEEMTIVLQHQFENLKVEEELFSVVLSFDGVSERIVVPFAALTAFADPSVKFGLQFRYIEEYQDGFDNKSIVDDMEDGLPISAPNTNKFNMIQKNKPEPAASNNTDNVVKLDYFRKKKHKNE